jgi:flagellar hook-length control protein FliK
MSIQPLSNTSPASEPPVQRRRAAEPEAGREPEPFTLPEARAEQAAAPAEPITAPAESRPEAAATPESEPKPKAGETVPTVPAKAAKPDVGALVTIAAAVAAGKAALSGKAGAEASDKVEAGKADASGMPEAGKADASKSDASKSDASKGESGEAKAAGEADKAAPETKQAGAELAPAIIVAPQMPAEIVAVPALPMPGMNPAAVPAPAANPSAAATGGTAAIGVGGGKPTSAQNTATQPAQNAAVAAQLAASEAKVAAGTDKGDKAQPAATSGQPSATAAPADELASFALAAGPANALAEFKPLEAAQQVQSPIDASALAQQAVAKAEPLRLLTALDQPAASTPPGVNGHGASNGQPTPLHVLPIEIGLKALSGARQFDIRLDPGELGRVDVNLSISDDGEVSARLVVDRVETLHLLQRDARTLERAFEQAGLKPSDGGVDITLRDPSDQSGFRQNRQQDESAQRGRPATGTTTSDDTILPAEPAPIRRLVRLGGVDLSI